MAITAILVIICVVLYEQVTCGTDMVWPPVTLRAHHGSTSPITCAKCPLDLWTRSRPFPCNYLLQPNYSRFSSLLNARCVSFLRCGSLPIRCRAVTVWAVALCVAGWGCCRRNQKDIRGTMALGWALLMSSLCSLVVQNG